MIDLSSIPTDYAVASPDLVAYPSVDETVYTGSAICPECGVVMDPIQVIYGYGVCPECQAERNSKLVRSMLTGPAGKGSE